MDKSVAERQAIWQTFLQRWPLQSLPGMTLTEYTSVDTGESFCNWLEQRTEDIGSIWGGSAFKFGVFARKDSAAKEDGGGRRFADDYGWMEKYGDSPAQAFEAVRAEICKVAQAAARGELAEVDNADLGEAVRWKIAFLYQNQATPLILPIFKGEYLKLLLDKPEPSLSAAHHTLLAQRGDTPLLEYGDQLWARVQVLLNEQATPEKARAYLDGASAYHLLKDPTDKIAGYEADNGQQLALSLKGKSAVLYLSPGPWQQALPQAVTGIRHYPAEKSRNSNIAANAPTLKQGNSMLAVTVNTMDELAQVCELYAGTQAGTRQQQQDGNAMDTTQSQTQTALNTILYGPPGTGKTYATTAMAVEIAEPQAYRAILADTPADQQRAAIKALYEQLVASNRIAFTTFHQSFSYEDFIEGIRAKTSDDGTSLSYEVEDGVFKSLAQVAASLGHESGNGTTMDLAGRRFWKMSLGNTLHDSDEGYQDCLEQGYMGLGWGGDTDFSDCQTRDQVSARYSERTGETYDHTAYNVSVVNTFKNVIRKGDLVVVSDGNHKFRAIGEVVGDYQCVQENSYDFYQQRKVKWLRSFEPSLPKEMLFKKALSQMTLYELRPATIRLEQLQEFLSESQPNDESPSKNFVLIIDEINRGNIARIFGELITLLEPDKRKSGADERSVILPYSKQPFAVPANLYLIGTMNTADKSLAQLDLALRRRFEFAEIMPDASLLDDIEVHGVSIGKLLAVINSRIEVLLDRDHLLGHSYFLPLRQPGADKPLLLAAIFEKKIIPLLQEYFFSDWEKITWVLNDIGKPEAQHRFIQLAQDQTALNRLFTPAVAETLQDRRYRINPQAFTMPEAYQGIVIEGA